MPIKWFAVGDYKKMPNEVGDMDTTLPEETADRMKALLAEYNSKKELNQQIMASANKENDMYNERQENIKEYEARKTDDLQKNAELCDEIAEWSSNDRELIFWKKRG